MCNPIELQNICQCNEVLGAQGAEEVLGGFESLSIVMSRKRERLKDVVASNQEFREGCDAE